MFRKAALEKLSTPEQLDRLITVINPRGWIALITVVCVLAVVVLWSIVGAIPFTVSGPAIMVKSGGVAEVNVLGAGLVTELDVGVGNIVEKGQIIARLDQPELRNQIAQTDSLLQQRRAYRQRLDVLATGKVVLGSASLRRKQQELIRAIASSHERIHWLEARHRSQALALREGLVIEADLRQTEQLLEQEKAAIGNAEAQLKSISADENSLGTTREQDLLNADVAVAEAERKLESERLQLERAGIVVSPFSGRVTELRYDTGSLVQAGAVLVSLEPLATPLQVIAFIAADAKKIKPGMTVHINPATVKREDYGFLVGKVKSVSALPSTQEGVARVLKNSILVQQMVKTGAPYLVEVSLDLDPSTFSGYRWTSTKGPPVKMESGIMCQAFVVVERRRPLALLMPEIKKFLGLP